VAPYAACAQSSGAEASTNEASAPRRCVPVAILRSFVPACTRAFAAAPGAVESESAW